MLLITDVVDSTSVVGRLGTAASSALWARHDRAARGLLVDHNGVEIDRTDGFLLLFEHAHDAVEYALAYHDALAELGLEARVGIHESEVVLRENPPEDVRRGAKPFDIDGVAKPVTARVMGLARGGQTLLTAPAPRP